MLAVRACLIALQKTIQLFHNGRNGHDTKATTASRTARSSLSRRCRRKRASFLSGIWSHVWSTGNGKPSACAPLKSTGLDYSSSRIGDTIRLPPGRYMDMCMYMCTRRNAVEVVGSVIPASSPAAQPTQVFRGSPHWTRARGGQEAPLLQARAPPGLRRAYRSIPAGHCAHT